MEAVTPCPRCSGPLSDVVLGDAAFRGCARCGGAWVDSRGCAAILEGKAEVFVALAEQLAERATVAARPFDKAACPVCNTELALGAVPPTGTVVQNCPAHGTWFDRGALPAVAGARQGQSAAAVVVSAIEGMAREDAAAASPTSRLIAWVVDGALEVLSAGLPALLAWAIYAAAPGFGAGVLMIVFPALGLVSYWTWQFIRLTLTGQTIGKSLEGIQVVQTDGSPAGFLRGVFLRSMTLPLAALMTDGATAALDDWAGLGAMGIAGLVGLAVALDPWLILLPARRAFHDYIAGTRVITTYVRPERQRLGRTIFGMWVAFVVLAILAGLLALVSKC
jgi:Zn-finger nucleic acid-binding protein/uncharacterized RDD family membrane protein YckC